MELPNSKLGGGSTAEKVLKNIIPIGLIALGFYFWGTISAFVVETLKNTLLTVVYGGILVALFLFIWSNPAFISQTYTNLCRKMVGWFIKMDPLSYMDRYVETLVKKKANLDASRTILAGKREKLSRKIDVLKAQVSDNLRLGAAALKTNNQQQASLYGAKVAGDNQSIQLFTPLYQRTDKSVEFMSKLSENWSYSIESLRYEIDRKRTEFETIKETVRGLKSAEDFINSGSEEARLYGESLLALEEQVTQKIGYINEFEKQAKGIMSGIDIEKQANQDAGLKVLEEYMNNGKLLMTDFTKLNIPEVEKVPVRQGTYFNVD